MLTPRLAAPGARWHDDEEACAAIRGADYGRAYDAVTYGGHAAVALAGGLRVDRIETSTETSPPSESLLGGRVLLAPGVGGPIRRLPAWAAGPAAAELLCGAAGDSSCTPAFHDTLDDLIAAGVVDGDDEQAIYCFAEYAWEEAREVALAVLRRPGVRRATIALAARLLSPGAVLAGDEAATLYADAVRAPGPPWAGRTRSRGRRRRGAGCTRVRPRVGE